MAYDYDINVPCYYIVNWNKEKCWYCLGIKTYPEYDEDEEIIGYRKVMISGEDFELKNIKKDVFILNKIIFENTVSCIFGCLEKEEVRKHFSRTWILSYKDVIDFKDVKPILYEIKSVFSESVMSCFIKHQNDFDNDCDYERKPVEKWEFDYYLNIDKIQPKKTKYIEIIPNKEKNDVIIIVNYLNNKIELNLGEILNICKEHVQDFFKKEEEQHEKTRKEFYKKE